MYPLGEDIEPHLTRSPFLREMVWLVLLCPETCSLGKRRSKRVLRKNTL